MAWQSCDDGTFTLGVSNSNMGPPSAPEPVRVSNMPLPIEETANMDSDFPNPNSVKPDDNPDGEQDAKVTERDKVLCLLSHFDRDQLDRYEAFRRAAFPKPVIRTVN